MKPEPCGSIASIWTSRSGNAVMKLCADSVIAARPIDGAPLLIVSDPFSAKNEATCAGSWLHHAAVYRVAKSRTRDGSIGLPPVVHWVRLNSPPIPGIRKARRCSVLERQRHHWE